MIPRNELPPNKRFSILGLKRQQHQMTELKQLKSDYRERCKLRKQQMHLHLWHLPGTVIEWKWYMEMTAFRDSGEQRHSNGILNTWITKCWLNAIDGIMCLYDCWSSHCSRIASRQNVVDTNNRDLRLFRPCMALLDQFTARSLSRGVYNKQRVLREIHMTKNPHNLFLLISLWYQFLDKPDWWLSCEVLSTFF